MMKTTLKINKNHSVDVDLTKLGFNTEKRFALLHVDPKRTMGYMVDTYYNVCNRMEKNRNRLNFLVIIDSKGNIRHHINCM